MTDRVRSDAELIALVRERGSTTPGGGEAYDELVHRHRPQALRLATVLVGSMRAVELVDATSTEIAAVLDAGGGPDIAFRPYLLGAVRRAADEPGATSPFEPAATFTADVPDAGAHDVSDEAARAFAGLPERWQLALWHRCVEGEDADDAGELLGVPADEIDDNVDRAFDALNAAFLAGLPEPTDHCRATRDGLLAMSAGRLGRRGSRRVLDHARDCPACAQANGGITAIDLDLRDLLGTVVLGDAATGYLALGAEPPEPRRSPVGALAAIGRRPATHATAVVGRVRAAAARRPSVVAASGVALVLLGVGVSVNALTAVSPERAEVSGKVRVPLPVKAGATLDASPSASDQRAAQAQEKTTTRPTKRTPSPAASASARPDGSRSSGSGSSSPSASPTPDADVRVSASGGDGNVDWSVAGVPNGRSTALFAEAAEGVTLRASDGDCSGSGTNRLVCTVGPGGSGRISVFGLLTDTTVRLSAAAVDGYRDPDGANNSTSAQP